MINGEITYTLANKEYTPHEYGQILVALGQLGVRYGDVVAVEVVDGIDEREVAIALSQYHAKTWTALSEDMQQLRFQFEAALDGDLTVKVRSDLTGVGCSGSTDDQTSELSDCPFKPSDDQAYQAWRQQSDLL